MGTQIFKVEQDGTTSELSTEGAIKDVMSPDEVYVLVADDIRKIFLWLGSQSNVRSKFIGAKRSQEIRGQVGMHYSVTSVDEGDEEPDLVKIMGGKTEAGIAKEIKAEEVAAPGGGGTHPLREKAIFDAPEPANGMNIAGSKKRASQNTGPLYTGQESPTFYQEDQQINFDQIMQKLEEIKMPEGYERELIIIGNHAYSVVEKVQSFLGKKQTEKVIERVGSIPEGVFFAEGYSPRVLSENGKIVAIEFLRREGDGSGQPKVEHKDKKDILKEQIKMQLGGSK
ncbi:MAG: hypothetical protein GF383_08810 [Candidatus Lokiarchaeota archaeon]|nr:hypothetical protein [Candidatus Lokiarchaeota archaeon]MBD3340484.1 hypothetical protein [Candidatus Lokiarchaeota archaeon]